MKNLMLLSLFALILLSCKREHSSTITPKGKKYPVNFNVTNFAEQKGIFALNNHVRSLAVNDAINVKDYLDVLYYVVYDVDGRFAVSNIVQDSTMNNMGTITDSLPNGTYPVYIFAGKKGLTPGAQITYLPSAAYGYQGIGHYNWLDTFGTSFNFTVDNGSVTKDVTLNRVVSKLELQVLDNIPANANTINMKLYPQALYLAVNGEYDAFSTVDTTYANVTIPASAKGHPNFTIDKIMGGTEILSTIVITCKDASNHVIATATANNVEVDVNEKTILSGNLFTGNPTTNSQSFTVKIDTAWNSTPITSHF